MNNDSANNYNRDDSSPPRHRQRAGGRADPVVETAFDYILNTIFRRRPDQGQREHVDGDASVVPPLEPSSSTATIALTASALSNPPPPQSSGASSMSMDIDTSSESHATHILQDSQVQGATASGPSSSTAGRDTPTRRPIMTRTSNVDDMDNDMPDLLDLSDSDEDAHDVEMIVRDPSVSNLVNTRTSAPTVEGELIPDIPSLESAHHPRRVTVEDDPDETPLPSTLRSTSASARPEVVRVGSRRTREEVDDADDNMAEPESSPSPSVYATPSASPALTPIRTGTPAGGTHPDRPLRPLPRGGPPPQRTAATPQNVNPLFGGPGHPTATPTGENFDANTLLRQLFGFFGADPVGQVPAQTNGDANANATANAGVQTHSDESQAHPQPAPEGASANAANAAPTANAERQGNANAARDNAGHTPLPFDTIDIQLFEDGEDGPIQDGLPPFDFLNFGPLRQQHQQPHPHPHPHDNDDDAQPLVPVEEDVPHVNPNVNAGPGGAGIPGAGPGGADMHMFLDMLRVLMAGEAGNLNALFGDLNREDPARARRLVAGMDVVSVGLAKRMERVGGIPGVHEDAAAGEDAQCAVCWDSLWNAEGDSFESLSGKKEETTSDVSQQSSVPATASEPGPSGSTSQTTTGTDASSEATSMTVDPPEASTSAGAGTSTESSPENAKGTEAKEEKKELPPLAKVVSLPCAHVFHSSCLLPWFSRPGQTTCPVCRFNIDPENLTYRPSQRMQPPPPQQGQQQQQNHTQRIPRMQMPPGMQMPGMQMPMGPGTGAHWTIHTGPDIGPQWTMGGAPRPRPTPLNRFMRSENSQAGRPAGATPSPGASGSTQAGSVNQPPRDPRGMFYVPPVPPFTGRFQNGPGPHVHPNINPHILHQRIQADQRRHAPTPREGQTPGQSQPGPHMHPAFDGFFIHVRPPRADGQQQAPQPQTPAQFQPQPGDQARSGPQIHTNTSPEVLNFREFIQRAQRDMPWQGRPHLHRQDQQGEPQAQQQQQGHEQRQQPGFQFGVGGGTFNPQGEMVTMNVDFFFTANVPEGEQRGDQAQQAPPNSMEAQPPVDSANEQGATNASAANGTQQGPQAGRQHPPLTLLEIFTRSVPFPAFAVPLPAGPVGPMGAAPGPQFRPMPAQSREQKEWAPPPPPGLTLRQRIEKREQESGLRCDDVSCGLAPTDEDPTPQWPAELLKTIAIRRDVYIEDATEPACVHRFHASCLVDAGRVAGWGVHSEDLSVEVSCPVCRTVGHIERVEWEAAERASVNAFT